MKRTFAFAIALLLTGTVCAQEPTSPAPGAESMVAMRDGTKLATSVYLPDGDGPWPAILKRTPYGKDISLRFDDGQAQVVALPVDEVTRYTDAGYALVLQDVRGRFRSEGDYVPYESEILDGHDSVEWVAAQPFCNGRVGMSGASALGIHTNLAAAAAPPHLVAGFVQIAPSSLLYEGRFVGGAFKWAHGSGWMRRQGLDDEAIRAYAARAVRDQRWLDSDFIYHRAGVEIPMYNVGGWYDAFSRGSVDNFMFLQRYGREGARGHQKLRMGPFGHGPQLAGDLAYPGRSGMDSLGDDELRWFDHWLKGEANGIMDEPPVRYYMMAGARGGAPSARNGYRTSSTWPPDGVRTQRLYAAAGGGLTRPAPGAAAEPSRYAFDPAKPVATFGGANLMLPIGPDDQRQVGERPDYLRFQTEPLTEPVAIAGPVSAELYVSTDGPDTDVVAKLVDVYPDGYEALLADTIVRLRFRHGRRPQDIAPMQPGKVERLVIDLWHTAATFEPGHRIALHVTSSNHPRFDVNPNTGEPPGGATPPRVAHNALYHDADRPSALLLPILPAPLQ